MGYTGINLLSVKSRNRSQILKLLNDHGPTSRKDLAEQLGLTTAAVSTLCGELLTEGILYEKGEVLPEEGRKAGRRKILLDIDYDYRYVLCIAIEANECDISVCNLRGEHCITRRINTNGAAGPEVFLKLVSDAGKALLWEQGIERSQLLGAGVTVPGIVRRTDGVASHAYRIWDKPVAVQKLLEANLECPVAVENNVKAFALAELLYGSGKTLQNMVFIKWGPGVGSAIVTDRRIYEDRNFKSAEIGHICVDPNGLPCRCGRRGCLETRVATHQIVKRLQSICTAENTPKLWKLLQGDPASFGVRKLYQALQDPDVAVAEAVDEEIQCLASVTAMILTMLAPDQLIVFGQMFELPYVLEGLISHCSQYDPAYDGEYIRMSELNGRTEYIGPLAAAASSFFFQKQ